MGETKSFLGLIDELLQARYCISLVDTGYGEDEWLAIFGDLSATDAVSCFGEKYDLDRSDTFP